MPSVLQPWVHDLTFMQQSVLLGVVRGPDGTAKYSSVKMLLRWYRRCILISALDRQILTNPYDVRGGSFTGPSLTGKHYTDMEGQWCNPMDEIVDSYLKDIDAVPSHFQTHFMHAVEILGYKHPDPKIMVWWNRVYVRLVHAWHLFPETEEQMDIRLGDNREGWLSRSDPATVR